MYVEVSNTAFKFCASDMALRCFADSASDAYAGLQLYHVMDEQRQELDPTPPLPHHAELNLPIRLADGVSISTLDESLEIAETEVSRITSATILSASFITSVKETIQEELDSETAAPIDASIPKSPIAPKTSATVKSRSKQRPKDARVLAAETKLAAHRTAHRSIRAAPSAIRAYYIWFDNTDLDPLAIAKMLRDPPLQTNTVVSYILEAIKLEKFPYAEERLRDEVMPHIPKDVLMRRYKSMINAVQSK
jgi:exonuclease 3'-5' domain-containing protein 2